jgi:hypothetical protein
MSPGTAPTSGEAPIGDDGRMSRPQQRPHQACNAMQLRPSLHPGDGDVASKVAEAADFSRIDGTTLGVVSYVEGILTA